MKTQPILGLKKLRRDSLNPAQYAVGEGKHSRKVKKRLDRRIKSFNSGKRHTGMRMPGSQSLRKQA